MDLTMDIAALSVAKQASSTQSAASIMLLSKTLDTEKQMGDNFIKMMEQSVNPNLGQNIDIRV